MKYMTSTIYTKILVRKATVLRIRVPLLIMRIKFLTLNTWHGGMLMQPMLDFLAQQNADIMVFQEVNKTDNPTKTNYDTNNLLHKNFPSYSLAFDAALKINYHEEGVIAEHGNTALSRFPITKHELVYFDNQYTTLNNPLPGENPDYRIFPKYMQKSWISISPKIKLLVINLHGVWDFHGNDTPERLKMKDAILQHAKGEEYVIIAGDSNVRWQTKTISELMNLYPSAITSIPTTTFNMLQKNYSGGYATAAVDIILASPNIQVIEGRCHPVNISDHLPLTATVQLS